MCIWQGIAAWFGRVTPDGQLQAIVLGVQLVLIWLAFKLSKEAEVRSQRHDRLSVKPYLDFRSMRQTRGYRPEVENHGLGVAIISDLTIWIDGHPQSMAGEPVGGLLPVLGLTADALELNELSSVNRFVPPVALKAGGVLSVIDLRLRPGTNP